MKSIVSPVSGWVLLFMVIVSPLFEGVLGQNTASPPPVVKAEFVSELSLPGQNNQLLRPSAIHIDRQFNEVLISDPGHNRIVIFDNKGIYRFEFSGGENFSTPGDLVVDSEGQIYVVGTTREGRRLFVFDFDGLFLHELELFTPQDSRVAIGSLAIDEQDELVVYDPRRHVIVRFNTTGEFVTEFHLFPELSERTLNEMIVGKVTAEQGKLLLPVPTLGKVYVYSRDGDLIKVLGYSGSRAGEMTFPVKALFTPDSSMLVLDKHRHNVLCFNQNYDFIGEFGGRGFNPGWFYHPTLLAIDAEEQIYIGQVFANRIQICQFPEEISNRRPTTTTNSSSEIN
jgi:outer membrane protein assembly factor BamB